ncbi:hypothetical protein ACFY3V_35520 [Streptosporangium sp. NPDC000095]|uniref:hypothetical protein n=1 Tax=Streptosporangium sp. NPDC000095 TaxID=3366184 RepID=UPI0036C76254
MSCSGGARRSAAAGHVALGGITPAGREVPETACREERGPDVPPGVADGCDHFREQLIKPITVV